ncbi:MAG TPA: response regulator [Candidatus Limnocylindria bacterium]|nr:response regulator [Candidatus Limnocylindria bacterium]
MAGEKILVVDDEGQIRKLAQTFLQRHGYVVVTANDGYEALLAIRKDRPHLVITDVAMPNLNGLELTRRLRGEAGTARMPIIMLSARKQADDVLTGYAMGADEYVAKPVELAVLAAKVELLLKRSQAGAADSAATDLPELRNGRVCLFLHGKGGVGTTTPAVNGSIALAGTMIYRVSLLDLSLEFGNAAMLLDVKPPRTLADLSDVRIEEMDATMFDLFVAPHASGVRLVTGADLPERAELVTVPAVQHALDRLRATSDYVLVDSAASFSQQTLAAVDVADVICVVTSAHLASLKATSDVLKVLEKLGVRKGRVIIALNRTTASGVEVDQATRFLGRKPELVIPYTAPFDDAADQGRPLVVTSPQNAGAHMMRELAAQIAMAAPVKH